MYAVLFKVDVKPDWEGDLDAELDTLVENVKAVPGFIRGTWARDGMTGVSFLVLDNEETAKAMVADRNIPPEAGVTFHSADLYEIIRDV